MHDRLFAGCQLRSTVHVNDFTCVGGWLVLPSFPLKTWDDDPHFHTFQVVDRWATFVGCGDSSCDMTTRRSVYSRDVSRFDSTPFYGCLLYINYIVNLYFRTKPLLLDWNTRVSRPLQTDGLYCHQQKPSKSPMRKRKLAFQSSSPIIPLYWLVYRDSPIGLL